MSGSGESTLVINTKIAVQDAARQLPTFAQRAELLEEIVRAVYEESRMNPEKPGGIDGRDSAERTRFAKVLDAAVEAHDTARGIHS